jgi:hypothetical protein
VAWRRRLPPGHTVARRCRLPGRLTSKEAALAPPLRCVRGMLQLLRGPGLPEATTLEPVPEEPAPAALRQPTPAGPWGASAPAATDRCSILRRRRRHSRGWCRGWHRVEAPGRRRAPPPAAPLRCPPSRQ